MSKINSLLKKATYKIKAHDPHWERMLRMSVPCPSEPQHRRRSWYPAGAEPRAPPSLSLFTLQLRGPSVPPVPRPLLRAPCVVLTALEARRGRWEPGRTASQGDWVNMLCKLGFGFQEVRKRLAWSLLLCLFKRSRYETLLTRSRTSAVPQSGNASHPGSPLPHFPKEETIKAWF